jgi:uncharacterized membrane protein YhaH (DUF805 family)
VDHDTNAAAGFIATLLLFYTIVGVAIIAFSIWVYWRIFAKAGYNGALSLLNFIPGVGQLICIIILAFGRWPIEDRLAALSAPGSAPVPPSPGPAPGTSVMPTS